MSATINLVDPRKPSRGLSLLEVVFALGLFFMVFSFVFGVFPAAYRASAHGRNQVTAVNLAREYLSVEKTKSYDAVVSSGPVTVPISSQLNGVTVVHNYQVNVDVTEVEPDKQKTLLVTVRWGTSGSKVELETLVCKW